MAEVSPERLAREVDEATPFPQEAGGTMARALQDAFPRGADAQCPAALDGRDGVLVAGGGALWFARYEDGGLSVTGLGPLRGGVLTRRYFTRENDDDGYRVGYRYAHERGTIVVEETGGRESAQIFALLQGWATAG